jgi:hypothetical protein
MSHAFRWPKGALTNSTEPQLNQNAQSIEHTTGKRIPCGLRDKENTIQMDMIEIKLNEIAVAIGAPMKPRRIGLGLHTI